MDTAELRKLLSDLPLGAVQYLPAVGSTNDIARTWLAESAPDLALIAADEQTAGRGQAGRTWQSPASMSLAFSLVLKRDLMANPALLPRLTALGALAVCAALSSMGLHAKIKWPNDVLLDGRKAAGILAEAVWSGSTLEGVVLGIGVNVHKASVPAIQARENELRFPATSIEDAAGKPVDRWLLLANILRGLIQWREKLDEPAFLQAWSRALAFQGEPVLVVSQQSGEKEAISFEGVLHGLAEDGALCLRSANGQILTFHTGEVRLHPQSGLAPKTPTRGL